jgi:hypothetical protein
MTNTCKLAHGFVQDQFSKFRGRWRIKRGNVSWRRHAGDLIFWPLWFAAKLQRILPKHTLRGNTVWLWL